MLYFFWKQYIGTPMVLVGGSIGGAFAIHFALEHPDAVESSCWWTLRSNLYPNPLSYYVLYIVVPKQFGSVGSASDSGSCNPGSIPGRAAFLF